MKIVSPVTFDDEYKILKTESRIMVKSLRTLKAPLFLGLLRNPFIIYFNDKFIRRRIIRIYRIK